MVRQEETAAMTERDLPIADQPDPRPEVIKAVYDALLSMAPPKLEALETPRPDL
jgi:hypothetical protein